MAEKEIKARAVIFSAAEQKILMELYDGFKSVITRKKRGKLPQTIADRVNA